MSRPTREISSTESNAPLVLMLDTFTTSAGVTPSGLGEAARSI